MQDHFSELFEWDENGVKRRKKHVLPDGKQMHFTMQMMDAAYGFHQKFSDGSPDHTNPHQPGYRFADIGGEARSLADAAYHERSARMENAWRRKGDAQAADNRDANRDAAPLDDAATAYAARTERMKNAWKQKEQRDDL